MCLRERATPSTGQTPRSRTEAARASQSREPAILSHAAIGDSLTDSGKTTEFQIGGNVGTLTILTFKHDPTGIIDLLSGVGGYATPGAAYAAVTTDHAGGSMLSLGVDGTIDFKGDPVADLSASNFKIG